jgi:hypothetical protein
MRDFTRKPRDRRHKVGVLPIGEAIGLNQAVITTFSPPKGVTWGYRFGIRMAGGFPGGQMQQVLITPAQGLELGWDLIRRSQHLARRRFNETGR